MAKVMSIHDVRRASVSTTFVGGLQSAHGEPMSANPNSQALAAETPEAVMRMVDSLRDRQDELVDKGVAAIRKEIKAYARSEDPAFLADVREHVYLHNDALLRSLAKQSPLTPEELLFVRPVATRRVGRIPLGDFMHAFRLYNEVFWDAVLEAVTDDETRAAALSMVGIVIRYINVAATYASEAYLEAESLLRAQGERLRRDLLEDLLEGRGPAPGPLLGAAREAGLEPSRPCLLIAARPVEPLPDEHGIRSAAASLARARGAAVQPLTVARHDEIVVVAPAEGIDAADLARTLADIQARLADQGITLAIGMSTIQPLEDLPAAYREACEAVERLQEAGGVLALPTLRAFESLTLFGHETASRLVSPEIRRFVEEDVDGGGLLTTTLLEYVAADLNATVAAERLYVHVNTVRYRLKKIAERTGCDLRRLSEVLDLLIAVHIARA
jgi:PucR C-terminal helix-turn-helix domain/GGDEF-like domain